MLLRKRMLFVLASFLSCTSLTWAVTEQKLTASDAVANDRFGHYVSIDGDVALVGAYRDDDACTTDVDCNTGSAYVYRQIGGVWIEEAKLTASDGAANDWFGWSVSLSGDVALVGVYHDDDACPTDVDCNSGSAYVYRQIGGVWIEEAKLTASDGAERDWFGRSVSLSGDVALVGAQYDDCTAGINCGSAYVYRFNGSFWVEETKLTASDAAFDDRFGRSVSLSGNVAIVGAFMNDCPATDRYNDCGSAYVYRFNGSSWTQEAKLTASDRAADDWFGLSVSLSGNVALVGAYRDDCMADINNDCGSAYVFRWDDNGTPTDPNDDFWVEEAKLTASDAAAGDRLGYAVSLSGDVALVGAHRDDDACPTDVDCDSGSAYVYRQIGGIWIEMAKLTASDAAGNDLFGSYVSVSGDRALVGAYLDDCTTGGPNCGSAYVFDLNCGNGVLDSGEQCDDGGESATCDADCTFAECGDGTLNVTAGEVCDDGNTEPGDGCDETCRFECIVSDPPGTDEIDGGAGGLAVSNKNRYLSFKDNNIYLGRSSRVRVTLADIPVQFVIQDPQNPQLGEFLELGFVGLIGTPMWVGEPEQLCTALSGAGFGVPCGGTGQTIRVANLVCEDDPDNQPRDWNAYASCRYRECVGGTNDGLACTEDAECPDGNCVIVAHPDQGIDCTDDPSVCAGGSTCEQDVIHVYHEIVFPGGQYDVQLLDSACSAAYEANYSPALELSGPVWGDLAGARIPPAGGWTPPNANAELLDLLAIEDAAASRLAAPIKSRSDLEGVGTAVVDGMIGVTEILRVQDAIQRYPYPYTAPPPPCGP